MTPTIPAEKLVKVETEISSEKGPLNLFGLFLPNDAPDRWDLVISANWISSDTKKDLDFIVSKLNKYLSLDELITIARIAIIPANHPFVKNINSAVNIQHGNVEIQNSTFNNLTIQKASIVTSSGTISIQGPRQP